LRENTLRLLHKVTLGLILNLLVSYFILINNNNLKPEVF
ncbi:MAG: hypothetical protein ACI9WV_000947, partial [Patiriisocius sp.]